VYGESLFHSFFQAARGAGIDPFQFPMDLIQRPPGIGLARHRVCRDQLALDAGLVLIRQLIQNIPPFVHLTALNQRILPGMPFYRG
jgi:hypothetical protein